MSKVLEYLVKNNGFIRAMERDLKMNTSEIEKELVKQGLPNRQSRQLFMWKIQLMAEQAIHENSTLSNAELIEQLMKSWKKEMEQTMSKEVFSAFLDRSLLSDDKQKKAFSAICSGSFSSYLIYAANDERLFGELLSRFLLYFAQEEKLIQPLITKVMEKMVGREKLENTVYNILRKLGFQTRNGTIIQKNTKAAVSLVSLEEWPFAQGMTDILMPVLKEINEPATAQLYEHISQWLVAKEQTSEEIVQEKIEVTEEPEPAESVELVEPAQKNVEQPAAEPQPNDLLDQIIQAAEQLKVASGSHVSLKEKIRELEEENKRLYTHLERIEREKQDLQYKKLLEVFQAIAGKQSRYLLSELFNTVLEAESFETGRFKNLFNELRLVGVEPVTYGLELNKDITLTKEKLRDKFMLSKPIVSEGSTVTIRLIRQGWAMNERILVYPLAEEVVNKETIEQ